MSHAARRRDNLYRREDAPLALGGDAFSPPPRRRTRCFFFLSKSIIRYAHTLEALGEEPSPDSILSAPVIGFGNGTQKLHKTLVTVLRSNEARLLNDVPKICHAMTPEPRIIVWGALPFR